MHDTLQPVLVLLATAVLVVVLFRHLKQPPLLGYLIVGVATVGGRFPGNMLDMVREAIDVQYAELRPQTTDDADEIIRRIFEQHPDPPDLPARDYDVHDRKQAKAAILRKLNRERP